MTIELLYFEGCPCYETLLPKLRELLDAEGIAEPVARKRVESPEDAERERFLGSPTLRVDGSDIEPGAAARADFGLKCRLYRTGAGTSPLPSERMIRDALRAAA